MTVVDADLEQPPLVEPVAPSPDEGAEPIGPPDGGTPDSEAPANVVVAAIVAFLAASAAGLSAGGLFSGGFGRVIGVLGALVGAGLIAVSYRFRSPRVAQYAAGMGVLAFGALLVAIDPRGGSQVIQLVVEAVREGGLAQAPLPLDPGWKFLLAVQAGFLAVAGASLAGGLNRPVLAIATPVPAVLAAVLVQPSSAEVLSGVGALVLLAGAMAVSYGEELSRQGATSGGFEARRLARGAGILGALVVALILLTRVGFLFPPQDESAVIPPKRPENPPPQIDRVLFTVESQRQLTWRLGVLDVYDDNAWMTPPFDRDRLRDIPPDGTVPLGGTEDTSGDLRERETFEVTFEIAGLTNNVLPVVAGPLEVEGSDTDVQYDPRTQSLRLPGGRVREGLSYTVEAYVPPSAEELSDAGEPPGSVEEFVEAPPPPRQVADLLEQAPTDDTFNRLQYLRNEYFKTVVAAGAGNPVDVSPGRVAEMLDGEEATPYEITAGEALLARWAGVPARMGYGWYGGERLEGANSALAVRPKHGATWLEVYFDGYGWVPILGTPQQAKSSLTPSEDTDASVRPTDELALVTYVPVRNFSVQLLYTLVQYWVLRAAPLLFLGALAVVFYPAVLKGARRLRRRRWATAQGPAEQILAAYAELRDYANDLNVGHPTMTPLEWAATTIDDTEHDELAWLVTRCLWGDLARDRRIEDADVADEMAGSLLRRLRRAQPFPSRIAAAAARSSLRDPYSRDIPNLWPDRSLGRWLRAVVTGIVRRPRLRRPAPALPLLLLVVILLLGGCVRDVDLDVVGPDGLPERIVPAEIAGVRFEREPSAEEPFERAGPQSLVTTGLVFSIREGDVIQGSYQVASLKPGLLPRQEDVQEGILQGLGGGRFQLTRIGDDRVYVLDRPEQRLLLWFSPSGRYYDLLVARRDFGQTDEVFVSLLAYQRGDALPEVLTPADVPPIDPRRGFE